MTARKYPAALRYVTVGMLLAWRHAPHALTACWLPLCDLVGSLIGLLLVMVLPLLAPLSPLVAWLYVWDMARRDRKRAAARTGMLPSQEDDL